MSNLNIVAIIQARMGSSRLPGKVLMKIDGKHILEIMLDRVSKSKMLSTVVVATSNLPQDGKIYDYCVENNHRCFRGSESDVLSRYYHCAIQHRADIIVRLTADCPLVDPDVIDQVVTLFIESGADFASNTVPIETSTYPDGSDVEVFSLDALIRANNESLNPKDREHVTFQFWKYDLGYKSIQLINKTDLSRYRFTVDYQEDFEVISHLYKTLSRMNVFGNLEEIVAIINNNNNLINLNSSFKAGEGW